MGLMNVYYVKKCMSKHAGNNLPCPKRSDTPAEFIYFAMQICSKSGSKSLFNYCLSDIST